ncbi:NACHT domain-containing protein [Arachnia propionica]|nr:NACHT domain-containing protein [Arachnia propionica]
MAVLNHYQVGRIMERLGLSAKDQKAFELILQLLNEQNEAVIADIHEALYPFADTASANNLLKNLCNRFNAAAEAQGIDITVRRSTEKKGGAAARRLWFEGPTPPPDAALTPELDRIRHHTEITNTKGMIPRERDVVVLITFNEHEARELQRQFCGKKSPSSITVDGHRYFQLGTVGGMDVVHRISQQGTHDSQRTATDAWQAWNPKAIIGVGIAFGTQEQSQKIGDVLVSSGVIDYQLGKMRNGRLQLRHAGIEASYHLLNRFREWQHTLQEPLRWPRVRFGNILSGDKLIDDVDYRNHLKNLTDREVIGGEMEGLGLHHALKGHHCDWIIVKAICDFADGNKGNSTKERDQRTAAQNAAVVVHAALGQGPLYADSSTPGVLDHPPTAFCPPPLSDLRDMPSRIDDVQGTSWSLVKTKPASIAPYDGVDVLDFLTDWVDNPDSPPLCALLGEYGSGKTVSCQRLSERLHQEHTTDPSAPLPIYLDLREIQNLGSGVPTLAETVQECFNRGWRADRSYSLDEFWSWVDQGAVVIFDGLDEVLVKLEEKDGSAFTRGLLSLLDTAQQRQNEDPSRKLPKVLVSCRTQYFRTLNEQRNHLTGNERGNKSADSFAALQLLPFTREQIRRYLEGLAGNTDVDGTMELLDEVHNLADLASRPVTLKMISEQLENLEAKRRSGQIIRGVDIYEGLTQRWLDRDAAKEHIKPEHKLSLMEHLAAYLWRHESTRLAAIEIEDWFHEWRDTQRSFKRYNSMSPDLLEEDLRVATFLARRDEGKNSTFGFAHTSMHEYFLARHLLSAVRDDRPEGWAIRRPSEETLEFLGQLFDAEPDLIHTLNSWRTEYRPQTSELILYYGLHALSTGHPAPTLRDINLTGAQLDGLVVDGYRSQHPIDLSNANFSNASLGFANFGKINLAETLFEGTHKPSLYLRDCPKFPQKYIPSSNMWTSQYPSTSKGSKKSTRRLSWITGHRQNITSIACHPDGSTLATSSSDGMIIIWDSCSGEILYTLKGHVGIKSNISYHPDGNTLATTTWGHSVTIWSTQTGQKIHTLKGHMIAASYHPDGDTITTITWDGKAITWDTETGKILRTLNGHASPITAIAYHPDGSTLTTTSKDGTFINWDARTGEKLNSLIGRTRRATTITYHPSGTTFTTTSNDTPAIVWEAFTGKKLHAIGTTTGNITSVAYHPDGTTLTIVNSDNSASIWNAETSEKIRDLRHPIASIIYQTNGTILTASGGDKGPSIWDTYTGKKLHVFKGHSDNVTAVAYHPDGNTLTTTTEDGFAIIWETHTGRKIHTLKGHTSPITAIAYHPDGNTLTTTSKDGTFITWNTENGEKLNSLTRRTHRFTSIAYHPNGATFTSVSDDGAIFIQDATNNNFMKPLTEHASDAVAISHHPDGSTLITAHKDGLIAIQELQTGRIRNRIRLPIVDRTRRISLFAYHPDTTFATTSGGNLVRTWDLRTGKKIHTLKGHTSSVTAIAYHPDGNTLTTATEDGTAIIWDTHTATPIHTLTRHTNSVTAVAYHPNGDTLTTTSDDGTAIIWDTHTGKPLRIMGFAKPGPFRLESYASWDPNTNEVICCVGEAWRCLQWEYHDEAGNVTRVPVAETEPARPL